MKRSLGAKTLVYPTPVFIIGSYDSEGRPQCDGRLMVRHLLLVAPGGLCVSSGSHVHLRKRDGKKGLHHQYSW